MDPLNILLVEDHVEDATWVEIQLKRSATMPYTLHVCDYLSKAMQLMKKQSFSLIILDLCLPDNNGLNTLKELVKGTNVPVIIYTGINDISIVEEAFNAGISDYLVKGKTTSEELNSSILKTMRKQKSAAI